MAPTSPLFFLTLLLITSLSHAKDFLVGGSSSSWAIPSSTSKTLNQWAEASRFQVGDKLVWKYDGAKDSVLQVSREAYLACDTSSPIAEHRDGNTVVELARSGPYYFVSGAEGACQKGEKVIVVVMAERRGPRGFVAAPAPVEYDGPAAAPASGGHGLVVEKGLVGAIVGTVMVMVMLVL